MKSLITLFSLLLILHINISSSFPAPPNGVADMMPGASSLQTSPPESSGYPVDSTPSAIPQPGLAGPEDVEEIDDDAEPQLTSDATTFPDSGSSEDQPQPSKLVQRGLRAWAKKKWVKFTDWLGGPITKEESAEKKPSNSQLKMQFLTLLATLTTLISLTTSAPLDNANDTRLKGIAPWAKQFFHPTNFSLEDNAKGGCDLKFHGIFGCKDTVTVDATHKCGVLPKKVHAGNACGTGRWLVDNDPLNAFDPKVTVEFDTGTREFHCNKLNTYNLVC
ncbi:MAG: hypothetical protein Q9168_005742 [Polycauliona sp. 1 TL-2023]